MNLLRFLEALEAVEARQAVNALELLREKKRKQLPLTAIEAVILDAYYTGGTSILVEQAANELQHMQERLAAIQNGVSSPEWFESIKEESFESKEN